MQEGDSLSLTCMEMNTEQRHCGTRNKRLHRKNRSALLMSSNNELHHPINALQGEREFGPMYCCTRARKSPRCLCHAKTKIWSQEIVNQKNQANCEVKTCGASDSISRDYDLEWRSHQGQSHRRWRIPFEQLIGCEI